MAVAIDKSAHFYRAMELNMTIGSDVLRDIFQKCLQAHGISMHEFCITYCIPSKLKCITREQMQIISHTNVNLNKMDVTLLTMLLLNFMSSKLSKDAVKHINDLRKIRNDLAHSVKAELDDDKYFKEASALILGLAKSERISTFELNNTINELRQRELVNMCITADKILIKKEMYVVKLAVASGTEEVEQDKTLTIKCRLNTWSHELARGLNVGEFLRELKNKNVINDTELKQIEDGYSYKEQMELLVLHIIDQPKDYIYNFIDCLKTKDSSLAKLLVNSNADLREIESFLAETERNLFKRLLSETFKEDEESTVDTDIVHILMEEKVGHTFEFDVVKNYVLEQFPNVSHSNFNTSFIGLAWKQPVEKENEESSGQGCHRIQLVNMKCEEFAKYVGKEMFEVRESLLGVFKKAIREESITPKIFASMTKTEMKDIFASYLQTVDIKYGFGVSSKLHNLQKILKSEQVDTDTEQLETLRGFDQSVCSTKYRRWKVQPRAGNLLVAKDEFRFPRNTRTLSVAYMSKEIIRFLAACINGRKNGTIHFGIQPINANTGQIIGYPKNFVRKNINAEIKHAIEISFKENANIAHRCVRPLQIVPVVDGGAVYEVDVVPSSYRLPEILLTISYPPKGFQVKECFVYEYTTDCEILPIASDNIITTQENYQAVFKDRAHLDNETWCKDNKHDKSLIQKKLLTKLTGGRKQYLSDEFASIVVTGKLSGCHRETEIRRQLDIQRLCQSSNLILDFDDSPTLRESVEEDKVLFTIQTTEDIARAEKKLFVKQTPIWLYCNGYSTAKGNASTNMSIDNWIKHRLDSIKKALEWMRESIPRKRTRIIFFIYQQRGMDRDPMEEVARLAFITLFRQQCVFVSDTNTTVIQLKDELKRTQAEKNIDDFFHTSLSWPDISVLLKNICRCDPNTVCKLPHCDGHFVEMTKTEKINLKFTDIEIVSGEECVDEEAQMSEKMRRKKKNGSQDKFYKGCPVSWWNFYYNKQVGTRDHFEQHKRALKDKLSDRIGQALVEVHEIEHHPGAGGSTLGMNLLWYFSQFRHMPQKAYRCCTVKNVIVTEETCQQLQRFRGFKEGDCPKPLLILVDGLSEDSITFLKRQLDENAYKTGVPGSLYALVIMIKRVPISQEETDGRLLLKHILSQKERDWFEDKFRELETNNQVDVKTLVAFNCLRSSFNPEYMRKMVCEIMDGVSSCELDVLKCLALIFSYESDRPVPANIFDSMVEKQRDACIPSSPWGMVPTVRQLKQNTRSKDGLWTSRISDAMQLLIKETADPDYFKNGIRILSQPVAKQITEYIKRQKEETLVDIVNFVLEIAEVQAAENSRLCRNFVQIVGSLFKTRHVLDTSKGELKEKFSELVLDLEHEGGPAIGRGNVVNSMMQCFLVTKDPMVGQQLARYYIHVAEYKSAEETVQRSLQLLEPGSLHRAYLLDTYGRIYKSKAEGLLDTMKVEADNKIPDEEAANIIRLIFQAIEKFREGQILAFGNPDSENFCIHTEIRTFLYLLEKFNLFTCFKDRETFKMFLSDKTFNIENSSFSNLMRICPQLEWLRSGSEKQIHIENSLRIIEERDYQVRKVLYTIHSGDETLLLKLRERFGRFFGLFNTGCQFKYGIGLKSIMRARSRDPQVLENRVREAKSNLETCSHDTVDERDLLVYLGEKIVCLSDQAFNTERSMCTVQEYRRLLSYSASLVSITNEYPDNRRKYLESFLYYAMLHWPLKSRTNLDLDNLAKPSSYKEILCQWGNAYTCNHDRGKPKNYFALGRGTPGNEIVDLDSIWKEWRHRKKDIGRTRLPVFRDHFWRENFVQDRLERLEGTMNGTGNIIIHEAQYLVGTHEFKINTYYPCPQFCNRTVTFVLGFSWKCLSAFDVEEIVQCEETTDYVISENKQKKDASMSSIFGGAVGNGSTSAPVILKPDYTSYRNSEPSMKPKRVQCKPGDFKKKQEKTAVHKRSLVTKNTKDALENFNLASFVRPYDDYAASASPESLFFPSYMSESSVTSHQERFCQALETAKSMVPKRPREQSLDSIAINEMYQKQFEKNTTGRTDPTQETTTEDDSNEHIQTDMLSKCEFPGDAMEDVQMSLEESPMPEQKSIPSKKPKRIQPKPARIRKKQNKNDVNMEPNNTDTIILNDTPRDKDDNVTAARETEVENVIHNGSQTDHSGRSNEYPENLQSQASNETMDPEMEKYFDELRELCYEEALASDDQAIGTNAPRESK